MTRFDRTKTVYVGRHDATRGPAYGWTARQRKHYGWLSVEQAAYKSALSNVFNTADMLDFQIGLSVTCSTASFGERG